jgi:cystathionine beta-lyase/cystathionine gamma-synthase
VEKLLEQWFRAHTEAQYAEATAYCAARGARARALHQARLAERRAAKIARVLQTRYGVDPVEKLRNGEIK